MTSLFESVVDESGYISYPESDTKYEFYSYTFTETGRYSIEYSVWGTQAASVFVRAYFYINNEQFAYNAVAGLGGTPVAGRFIIYDASEGDTAVFYATCDVVTSTSDRKWRVNIRKIS